MCLPRIRVWRNTPVLTYCLGYVEFCSSQTNIADGECDADILEKGVGSFRSSSRRHLSRTQHEATAVEGNRRGGLFGFCNEIRMCADVIWRCYLEGRDSCTSDLRSSLVTFQVGFSFTCIPHIPALDQRPNRVPTLIVVECNLLDDIRNDLQRSPWCLSQRSCRPSQQTAKPANGGAWQPHIN